MKKLLHKVLKKSAPLPETGGRITNETVAEHRERILAGGRKFKYPMQYTKHRLLVISMTIVFFAAVSFFGFAGWQLYKAQSIDKFMYRLTQIVPVPVARVDGEFVRYSDYLREVSSAVHYLSTKEAINFSSDDGKRQLQYQERLALDKAIENAFVAKLAHDQNITVSQKEVDDFVNKIISNNQLGVSEDAYRQVIRDYYDWSFDEYKDSLQKQLLRQKVLAKLDTDAAAKIKAIQQQIAQGADFAAMATQQSEDLQTKGLGGDMGFVTIGSTDPSGIIQAAEKLQPGQVSDVIAGTDGLYLARLIERQGNNLHIAKIFVNYTFLSNKIAQLRQASKVQEFINVPPIATQ